MAVGIAWGLVLGQFFKSGDMAGPWLTILLGPPPVLLISPARPILSWQVPIVTAAVSGTLMSRDPGDPAGIGSFLVMGLLTWAGCSLLSSPWAVVFQRRAQRVREGTSDRTGAAASYIGAGLLVFIACALVILGIALTFYPADSSDPRNARAPFEGFLMTTVGIGVSVAAYRFAAKLGASKPVKDVLELVLGLGSIFGIVILLEEGVIALREGRATLGLSLPSGRIWCALAALETLAALVWLVTTARRARNSEPGAP